MPNAYAERTAGRFASSLWATGTQANLDGDYIRGSGHTKVQKIQVGEKFNLVDNGAPDLSMNELDCEAYANSVGLAFSAHDDAAITGIDWYDSGGCYCTSHYGKVDPTAGVARYTREWSTANGVTSTEAGRADCYTHLTLPTTYLV